MDINIEIERAYNLLPRADRTAPSFQKNLYWLSKLALNRGARSQLSHRQISGSGPGSPLTDPRWLIKAAIQLRRQGLFQDVSRMTMRMSDESLVDIGNDMCRLKRDVMESR